MSPARIWAVVIALNTRFHKWYSDLKWNLQARADAPRLLEAHPDLASLVNNAAAFYESSGAVLLLVPHITAHRALCHLGFLF